MKRSKRSNERLIQMSRRLVMARKEVAALRGREKRVVVRNT